MPAPPPDQQLQPAVIVNIDVTADDRFPDRYNGSNTDNGCSDDRANRHIVAVIRALYLAGHKIHLFTCTRTTDSRPSAEAWIDQHLAVPYEAFHMREPDDPSSDHALKSALYIEHIQGRYDVTCVLDHRAADTPMWQGHGLTCLLVRPAVPATRGGE
jgi:hypothetical protein